MNFIHRFLPLKIIKYLSIGMAGAIFGCLLTLFIFYFGCCGLLPFSLEEVVSHAPPAKGKADSSIRLEQLQLAGTGATLLGNTPYYMAVVNAAEKVTPSVVGITNYALLRDFWGQTHLQERATGSGVIIDSKGYIVTNYHVIEDSHEITVTLGGGEEIPAKLVGSDSFTDLAVLRIEKDSLVAAEFADSEKLLVGEPAIAIGNPLGLNFQQTVTLGVVSATKRQVTIQGQNFNFIQTDAAINSGNSGGALVNINGEVIGINTAKISIPGVEGMGFAIPSNIVREIALELIAHGQISRPWLGVYSRDMNPTLAQLKGLKVSYGAFIEKIVPNSPAEKSGLQAGDVIIEMDGKKVENTGSLLNIIYSHNIGDEVALKVIRENREYNFKVILGSLKNI